MFGRKKALFNMMDDSKVVANDFIRRIHYESYRPADYRLYPGLSEEAMIPKIDKHLEALFSGTVDDANGSMLDNILIDPYRESVPYLNDQRLNHKDMNRRLVACRISDREDIARIRDDRQEELEQIKQEYKDTCNRIAAVEEG